MYTKRGWIERDELDTRLQPMHTGMSSWAAHNGRLLLPARDKKKHTSCPKACTPDHVCRGTSAGASRHQGPTLNCKKQVCMQAEGYTATQRARQMSTTLDALSTDAPNTQARATPGGCFLTNQRLGIHAPSATREDGSRPTLLYGPSQN